MTFSFDASVPLYNGNPASAAINIISDFLGVSLDIPGVGFEMGATARGMAGLEFGYYATGGFMDIKYPAVGELNLATGNNTQAIQFGQTANLTTAFEPGVRRTNVPPNQSFYDNAGAGYAQQNTSIGFETFEQPAFATAFPYASAFADFVYDVNAGAYAQLSAGPIGYRRNFTIRSKPQRVTLLEADPGKLRVVGLADVQLFDRDIPIAGYGNLRVSYPDVQVSASGTQPDNSLRGFAAKPIIQMTGKVENLIPAIGPLLNGEIPPFGYNLLSVDAGPTVNLYQDFTFTPEPRARIVLSEPVMVRQSNGTFGPTSVLDFELGEQLDIRPIFTGLASVTAQPTYVLRNTLRNETGLSIGVTARLEALKFTSPVGDLGPVVNESLTP